MSDRDERGDRLAKRFDRDQSDESETSKTSNPSKTSKQSQPSKSSKTSKGSKSSKISKTSESDTTAVRDRPSVLMYLPEDAFQELDVRFDELNAKYKRETGEQLKKNDHYYPMIVEKGLEHITVDDFLED